MQFGQCAILQYSKTPSLRPPGFEDEDDDEDENENENEAPSVQETYHLNWLVTA